MTIPIFKVFSVIGIVSTWSQQALADGKVTAEEAAALGISLAQALGLPTSISLNKPDTNETAMATADEQPMDAPNTDRSPKYAALDDNQ